MIVAGFELTRTTRWPSSRKRAARLNAGVIELCGLTDDDRSRADDHDVPPRHWGRLFTGAGGRPLAALRLQQCRAPKKAVARVSDALVHAVGAVLPKLEARRHQEITAPRMWTRNFFPFEARLEVRVALLEQRVLFERRALLRRPGRKLMAARPRAQSIRRIRSPRAARRRPRCAPGVHPRASKTARRHAGSPRARALCGSRTT